MTTNSWMGPTAGGEFATAGDWTLGHVPNSSEDAVIDNTSNFTNVEASTDETVDSIALNAGAGLMIDGNSDFVALDGTGSGVDDGSISVSSGMLTLSGTFDNNSSGGIVLAGGTTASGHVALVISGTLTLTGSGTIQLPNQSFNADTEPENVIEGAFSIVRGESGGTLINESEAIIGAGTIGGHLTFTNDGTVATYANSFAPPRLDIEGSAAGGSFTNNDTVEIANDSVIVFGVDGATGSIANNGSIGFSSAGLVTTLEIAGNETITGTGTGGISMQGADPAQNEIVSDGNAATLTLVGQTLKGAGIVGDANLTLDFGTGTQVEAADGTLFLYTGNNTITSSGLIEASDGDTLDIESALSSTGTILVDGGEITATASLSSSTPVQIDGGTFDLASGGGLGSNVEFTGTGSTLEFDTGVNQLNGAISGGQLDDTIDLRFLSFNPNDAVVWQQTTGAAGTLSLASGGQVDTSLILDGQYTSGDFELANDGSGGTSIEVLVNPPPPGATTADMIMNNPSNGDYEIYNIGGNAILSAYFLGQIGAPWTFVGMGTFQAGDTSDMLLRNTSTGGFEAYYISNNNITNAGLIGTVGLNWNFAGTGDFDGQSSLSELLLRNGSSGAFELYQVTGGGVLSGSSVAAVGNNFTVEGFGHFSGASTTQMMMQDSSGDPSNGQLELYTYQPSTTSFAGIDVGKVGSNLSIVGMADLLGNGSTQMVMQQNNGDFWLYSYSAGTNTLSGQEVGAIGSNFHVVGFGPLGTAGQDEMLMQDAAGDFEVYQYNATLNALVGNSMGAVGSPWVVDSIAADAPSSSGATVGASTAELVQAMASIGMSAARTNAPAPLLAVPEQTQQMLVTALPHA